MPFTKEKHLKLVGLIVVFGSGLSGHCFSFPCQTAEIWFEGKGRKEETKHSRKPDRHKFHFPECLHLQSAA